jgi:uncharacterized membrane protein YdbT with pleckstrin-like domain|nr:PH domain-containing protein [Neorhizobium tomejilense]
MTSTGNERTVLKTRPDSRAVLLQFRYILKVAVALALLSPQAQSYMDGIISMLRVPGITPDMRTAILYGPSTLILFNVAYWFLYQKTCEFVLTDERLIVRYGVLMRVEDEVELYRVVDVTQAIGLIQRALGVGNIHVTSTDRTGNVVMPLIANPSAVRNAIRAEAERCKNRRGAVRILE